MRFTILRQYIRQDADLTVQWEVVEAFLAAAREGDFDALVAVLDHDVVLGADGGRTGLSQHLQGAETVTSQPYSGPAST
ncbi:MAG: hypothetical protein ACRDM0_17000 [Thermoleophilaceae bacterium]